MYVGTLAMIVIATFLFLLVKGGGYYRTPLEERFYHSDHDWFKPSGIFGHGLGIVGTLLILIGVFGYMAKKRYRWLSRLGRLKYWLEFHIFLCTLGPVLILFHTAFKFGGIVSVSFWSMVAVVASGVAGRFIYLQIPRTIEGRELSLGEVKAMKADLEALIKGAYRLDDRTYEMVVRAAEVVPAEAGVVRLNLWRHYMEDRRTLSVIRRSLRDNGLSAKEVRGLAGLVRREIRLNRRIARLHTMQELFRYWHVAHLPFALIMLVIMVIHVGVTLAFGYRWIF
jgi:hypothetical protein